MAKKQDPVCLLNPPNFYSPKRNLIFFFKGHFCWKTSAWLISFHRLHGRKHNLVRWSQTEKGAAFKTTNTFIYCQYFDKVLVKAQLFVERASKDLIDTCVITCFVTERSLNKAYAVLLMEQRDVSFISRSYDCSTAAYKSNTVRRYSLIPEWTSFTNQFITPLTTVMKKHPYIN